MPLIIIEGIDYSGKSTLAERIAEIASRTYTDTRLEHFGPPVYDPESPLSKSGQEVDLMLERVRDANFYNTFLVIDRFHWGSGAYAPVFRKDTVQSAYGSMSRTAFFHVYAWVQRMAGLQVYTEATDEVVRSRLDRGDDLLDKDPEKLMEQIREIRANYGMLISQLESAHDSARRSRHPYVPESFVTRVRLEKPEDTEYWAQRLVIDAIAKSDRYDDSHRGVTYYQNGKPMRITTEQIVSAAQSIPLYREYFAETGKEPR